MPVDHLTSSGNGEIQGSGCSRGVRECFSGICARWRTKAEPKRSSGTCQQLSSSPSREEETVEKEPEEATVPHVVQNHQPSLASRMNMKTTLLKACLLELARQSSGRQESALARSSRRQAFLTGRWAPSFQSPEPHRRGGVDYQAGSSSRGPRDLVPAMMLPRWESIDAYQTNGVSADKLHLLEVCSGGKSPWPPALACTICHKVTGGGEAILALSCVHIFCPVCFESFLRRRWADLAANLVDSSEAEQIPCPKCGVNLQRQDVHTLTEAEVAELAARAALAHQLSAAAMAMGVANSAPESIHSPATCLVERVMSPRPPLRVYPNPTNSASSTVPAATSIVAGLAAAVPQVQNVPAPTAAADLATAVPQVSVGPTISETASTPAGLTPITSPPSPSKPMTIALSPITSQPSPLRPMVSSRMVGNEVDVGSKPSLSLVESVPLPASTILNGVPTTTSQGSKITSPQQSPTSGKAGYRLLHRVPRVVSVQPQHTPPLPHKAVSVPFHSSPVTTLPQPRMLQQQNANTSSSLPVSGSTVVPSLVSLSSPSTGPSNTGMLRSALNSVSAKPAFVRSMPPMTLNSARV